MSHAWHMAALVRASGDLPDLESLLSRSRPAQPQTPEQQEQALEALFLAWGGDPEALARIKNEKGSANVSENR